MKRLSHWLWNAGLDPVSLRAAAARHKARQELTARHTGEGTAGAPTLIADAPAPSGLNGKMGEAETPPKVRRVKKVTSKLLLLAYSNRCEPTHAPSALPTRRVGSHLVLVVDHAGSCSG